MMNIQTGHNMTVIDAVWFNNIGIVKAKDNVTGNVKFYIRHTIMTSSEAEDAKYIAEYGIPFDYAAGMVLMPGELCDEN